mgnify:CR=1 FL=1
MDIMLILQIIVLLGAIFIGVRLGGIGIGYAGGAGVLDHVLQLFIRLKFIFPRMHDPGFLYEDMVPSIDHHLRDRCYFRNAARRRS